MNAHRIFAVYGVALGAFLGLGLLSSAQAAGTVWVSDTFGRSDDRVGQFADRGAGKWDQVLKNGKRLHSYRQATANRQYVELSGDGGQVRLYATKAMIKRGSGWQHYGNGDFRNGSPLQAGVDPAPPVVQPPPAMDTRGVVWASSSIGQAGDKIGGFVSHGDGHWDQVMLNGQKVHSYRQVGLTTEYVELSGSGGEIRLYRDKALMKRNGSWQPWTSGSFRSDVRIPIPVASTPVPSPTQPVVSTHPHGHGETGVGNAGILWVPQEFGRGGERVGQFVGRGDGKWDQLMKNGSRIGSYRETTVTERYVEMSGSGTTIRLYADLALMERGSSRRTWAYGGFQNGNPLQQHSAGSTTRRFW